MKVERIEILNRPGRPLEVCCGDQIVGVIRNDHMGWFFRRCVSSWDYFNPKDVAELMMMVDNKVKLLNITQRLTK